MREFISNKFKNVSILSMRINETMLKLTNTKTEIGKHISARAGATMRRITILPLGS